MPGSRRALRVRELRAQRDRPRRLVDCDLGELQRAGVVVGRAIGQKQLDRGRAGLQSTRAELRAQPQALLGGLGDIDVDRIERADRRERPSAVLAVTSAPGVTDDLPIRPLIGATIDV